jgi:hypothetical protein
MEVSSTKRGHRFGTLRLAAIGRREVNSKSFLDMRLVDTTSEVRDQWQDHRINTDKMSGTISRKSGVRMDDEVLGQALRSATENQNATLAVAYLCPQAF